MSESEVKKCPKCSGQMERRVLRVGGGGYFVELSDSESVWKMGKHDRINGFLCRECGFVELYKQMKKRKDRVREPARSLVR